MAKLLDCRLIVFGGLMLLLSVNAQAKQPICKTMSECQALRAKVNARIKELQAGPGPVSLDIARNTDGSLKLMKHADALQFCTSKGAHLPSIRELALLSMRFGAKGFVDDCGSDDLCYSIKAINADGSPDEFKFSYTGYQRPNGDLGGMHWFWSSSLRSCNNDHAFGLYAYNGYVDYIGSLRNAEEAVGCVPGR